jgi:hypothetical protein
VITIALRMVLGRQALVRLTATAAGVASGVVLLLLAAVAGPALHAHDVRAAWTTTSAHNARPAQNEAATDGLLWRINDLDHPERFGDRFIVRVDLAALGPNAPIPPGLTRLPGPGELAVSPALARLMAANPPDMLADRFPGRVAQTVGDAALRGPGDLVVFVGHDPAELRAAGDVRVVRSIETEPLHHGYDGFLKLLLVIGVLGLLLPVVVLVGTATRLAAGRREQRLAALRLVGATPRQTSLLAAVEAGVAATAGTALGFALFAVLVRAAARIPADGHAFFPQDARLSPWPATVIAAGVPVLAVMAALVSLRRVRISPLGVTRHAARPRLTWRRLLVLAAGLVAFAVTVPITFGGSRSAGTGTSAALAVAFTMVVAGIVAAGPWMTVLVGLVIGRFGGHPSALLAGRRLQDSPTAAFRSVSGLILAVFVASLISGVAPTAIGGHADRPTFPSGAVADQFGDDRPAPHGMTGLDSAQATRLTAALRAVPGVTRIVRAHTAPDAVTRLYRAAQVERGIPAGKFASPAVVQCADLRVTRLGTCGDPSATVVIEGANLADPSPGMAAPAVSVPAASLTGLPLAGVLVLTNGEASTVNKVRTIMVQAASTRRVRIYTRADITAQDHGRLAIQRLVSTALFLTLVIAGCSLTVSVAGGLFERKRPFALLRLTGARLRDLNMVAFAETAAPLLTTAAVSAGLGLGMAALIVTSVTDKSGHHTPWKAPDPLYFAALGGGLLFAVTIAMITAWPLLAKITSPQAARFE